MSENQILLDVTDLKKYFPIRRGIFRRSTGQVKAVDGISFSINHGETLGLVGESGSGKTTAGRCILRLYDVTDGRVCFRTEEGLTDITNLPKRKMKPIRRELQVIFQDPFSSLNPRMSIREILSEPLKTHGIGNPQERLDRIADLLMRVGLGSHQMNRFPHQFSGGQRQRIGIARALALNPKLIICDEPVSALDVSIQAQVLNLLSELQEEFDLTYLLIAHDLSVVEHLSDRVMVMYLGKLIEIATADQIYRRPKHPYTEALLAAIPVANPRSKRKRIALKGSLPDPSDPPVGCNFNTRCPYVQEVCRQDEPDLKTLTTADEQQSYAACHFAEQLNLKAYEE